MKSGVLVLAVWWLVYVTAQDAPPKATNVTTATQATSARCPVGQNQNCEAAPWKCPQGSTIGIPTDAQDCPLCIWCVNKNKKRVEVPDCWKRHADCPLPTCNKNAQLVLVKPASPTGEPGQCCDSYQCKSACAKPVCKGAPWKCPPGSGLGVPTDADGCPQCLTCVNNRNEAVGVPICYREALQCAKTTCAPGEQLVQTAQGTENGHPNIRTNQCCPEFECRDQCQVGSRGCPCTSGLGCDLGLVCNDSTLICLVKPAQLAPPPTWACQVGTEKCACTVGGGCDPYLVCDSNKCVTPKQCQIGSDFCSCTPGGGCNPNLICVDKMCTKPKNPGSCKGICGFATQFTSEGSVCYCDPQCATTGDCCDDYEQECGPDKMPDKATEYTCSANRGIVALLDFRVCCPRECGLCGGAGCAARLPAGQTACCMGPIISAGLSCVDHPPPCLITSKIAPPTPKPTREPTRKPTLQPTAYPTPAPPVQVYTPPPRVVYNPPPPASYISYSPNFYSYNPSTSIITNPFPYTSTTSPAYTGASLGFGQAFGRPFGQPFPQPFPFQQVGIPSAITVLPGPAPYASASYAANVQTPKIGLLTYYIPLHLHVVHYIHYSFFHCCCSCSSTTTTLLPP